MNKLFFKRLGAYIIDLAVVMLISSSLINLKFINPHYDKYMAANDKYVEVMDKYTKGDIELEEFQNQTLDLSYELNRNGYVYVIGDILIYILYFGVFTRITNGQTLGKKLFNIKIVSNKDKKLKFYNYLLRCIVLNGIIFNIVSLIGLAFKQSIYLKIYTYSSNLSMIVSIIIFLMILFYKDNRGLHDVIAQTKVIDLTKNPENSKIIEATEVKVQDEKQIEAKPQKNNRKSKEKK